eukprot:7606073-Pyramimonas_sp.AAC.1
MDIRRARVARATSCDRATSKSNAQGRSIDFGMRARLVALVARAEHAGKTMASARNSKCARVGFGVNAALRNNCLRAWPGNSILEFAGKPPACALDGARARVDVVPCAARGYGALHSSHRGAGSTPPPPPSSASSQ